MGQISITESFCRAAVRNICATSVVALLAGCGGGGGGDASTSELGVGGGSTGGVSGGGGTQSTPLEITNSAPSNYVWTDLAIGMPVYVDRAYTYITVPSTLQGLKSLQTANDDKSSTNPSAISFNVNQGVTVFVAYDARSTSLPTWLQSWTYSGQTLGTSDTDLDVWQKDFPAGAVTLGGASAGSGLSMYTVMVMPQGGIQIVPLAISGSPTQQTTQGTAYSFIPTVTGGVGARTLSITNKPAWATFNTDTGMLSGTPGIGDVGMTTSGIVITVTAGSETATLAAFDISVLASANGSATLSWSAPTTNSDGSALNDLAGYKIYYGTSPGNYPNFKRIDNPGVTTSMVENLPPGTWSFVVTALDFAGNESGYSNVAQKTILNP